MCPPTKTHCRHLANTIELCSLRPTRVHNPNGKSIGSAVFIQLTAESSYTLQWAPLSPKIAASHDVIWTPSNTWFLGPIRAHNPNDIDLSKVIKIGQCIHKLQVKISEILLCSSIIISRYRERVNLNNKKFNSIFIKEETIFHSARIY